MNSFAGPLLILLCTVVWGSAFVAQKLGADHFGPFAISCYRNLLAGFFLWGALGLRRQFARRVRSGFGGSLLESPWKRTEILGGAASGVVLFVAMLAQQLGIERTTPGVSAFLTANYVLIVPVLAWIVGKGRPGVGVVTGVGLALVGTYFISISTSTPAAATAPLSIGAGELWTLGCAVLFAVQIMVVDHFAPGSDMLRFSMVQMFVAGLVALPFVFLPSELARTSWQGFVQNLGQARTPPALAAILMSMESVFGAFFGWLLLGDVLSLRQIVGCLLVLSAVILSQLLSARRTKNFKLTNGL